MILNPNDEMITMKYGNTYILKADGSVLRCEIYYYRGRGCDTWKITNQTHKQIRQETLDYENAKNFEEGIAGITLLCLVLFIVAFVLTNWIRNA